MKIWILPAALLLAAGCATASKPAPAAAPAAATLPTCDIVADSVWLTVSRDTADGAIKAVSVDQIRPGDKIIFNHRVVNDGPDNVPAEAFEVDFFLDGKRLTGDSQSPAFDADKGITYTSRGWHWIAEKPGRHDYRLVVRPGKAIHDPDSGNNVLDGSMEVKP